MKRRPNYLGGAAALVWLVVVGVPLYAVIATSVRPQEQYAGSGPLALPSSITFKNIFSVLQSNFPHYVLNTFIVAFLTVAITLVLAVPISYTVVRGQGTLTSGVFRLFLIGLAIPSQAVIIPMFLLINEMGLYDSYWAIVLPTAAFSLPVSVLVLAGGMRDINKELYEAMALDGAGPGRSLSSLVIPLSKGSISTAVVFTALNAWNGFLFPLILTQSDAAKVVTLGIYDYIGQYQVNPPEVFTSVLLSSVPILLVYLFARKTLIRGLAGAGAK